MTHIVLDNFHDIQLFSLTYLTHLDVYGVYILTGKYSPKEFDIPIEMPLVSRTDDVILTDSNRSFDKIYKKINMCKVVKSHDIFFIYAKTSKIGIYVNAKIIRAMEGFRLLEVNSNFEGVYFINNCNNMVMVTVNDPCAELHAVEYFD